YPSRTGQASVPILPLTGWQRPVFLVNSRLGLLTATPARIQPPGLAPARVPLLPKLRGQLAEFLNEGSLAHLGVLTPTHLRRFAVRARPPLHPRLFSPAQAQHCRFDRSRHSPRRLRLTGRSFPPGRRLRGLDAPCPLGTQHLPVRVPPGFIA